MAGEKALIFDVSRKFPPADSVEDELTIFRALTQNAKDDAND